MKLGEEEEEKEEASVRPLHKLSVQLGSPQSTNPREHDNQNSFSFKSNFIPRRIVSWREGEAIEIIAF